MPKVLIICYYWPPAGGPGVQRWLSFVKYLPQYGIEPVLFIPDNPSYPIEDTSLLAEVPADITIYRQKISEPYSIARFFLGKKSASLSSGIIREKDQGILEQLAIWVRGNFFIPDARKSWVKPSTQRIPKILESEGIDTIITTGPPHSIHLIGLELKKRTGVKWIADFRDPWTSIGYHKKLKLTASSKRKHKDYEKEVLRNADKIITTSRTTANEFAGITSNPISVITNGYEERVEDPEIILDEKFSLSFIGSLLSGRNPENLWQVLEELSEEDRIFKEKLELKLVGVVSEDVLETIYAHQLKENTSFIPYVPHEEARIIQERSQVLLLLEIDCEDTIGIIPGKLFEYMAAKRPILAIGPEGWEAGQLVEESGFGNSFDYRDKAVLKERIKAWFEAFKNNDLQSPGRAPADFSRRALSGKLAEELKWE